MIRCFKRIFLMRTTLTIDDGLMSKVIQSTGRSNPLDAIRDALQSYLQHEKLRQVVAMRGKLELQNNWQALRKLDTLPAAKRK